MSINDVYLQLRAAQADRAVPRTSRRHVHLSDHPMVIAGFHLAGDPGAPVALTWGTDPDSAKTIVVPEPRNRQLRFQVLAQFATDLCAYLDDPLIVDPQVLLPNPATARWLFDIVGRFTWNQPVDGPQPVPQVVPRAGKHLMFLGQELDHPGSSTVLTAVTLLTLHYATGQAPEEDLNLGSLLGWVLPDAGRSGRETALLREAGPPAGPVSSPQWDKQHLERLVREYGEAAGNQRAEHSAEMGLRSWAEAALLPGWEQAWVVRDLLAPLDVADRVRQRRHADLDRFAQHSQRMTGDARFSARPGPTEAAIRLSMVESAQAEYESAMLLDDPLLLAARIADGSAVAGRVVAVDQSNRDVVPGSNGQLRRQLRPIVTLDAAVETFASPGDDLRLASSTQIRAVLRAVPAPTTRDVTGASSRALSGQRISLTVVAGANVATTVGRLPKVGELVVFSTVVPPPWSQRPDLPAALPWTHQFRDPDAPDFDPSGRTSRAFDAHRTGRAGGRSAAPRAQTEQAAS